MLDFSMLDFSEIKKSSKKLDEFIENTTRSIREIEKMNEEILTLLYEVEKKS